MVSVLVISAIFLTRWVLVSQQQLGVPFDLVHETPNLSTIKIIQENQNPYAPEVYDRPRFILTMYTPLYHFLVAALPENSANPFWTGRLVSWLAMTLAAAAMFFVAPGDTSSSWLRRIGTPALGVVCFLSLWPVTSNTAFLKNDPLGLMFSVWAIVLLANRRQQACWVIVAALFCVLALATKQTFVSSAIAGSLYLIVADRSKFAVFAISGLGFGIVFLVMAQLVWGSGFWHSTLGAIRQPIEPGHFLFISRIMFTQPLAIVVAITGLISIAWSTRSNAMLTLNESPFVLYVVTTTMVLLLTVGKVGSSTNYFIEPFLAVLMWIVYVVQRTPSVRVLARSAWLPTAVIVFVASELVWAKPTRYTFVTPEIRQQRLEYLDGIRRNVAALNLQTNAPRIVNLFTHLDTYNVTETDFLNDPFLFYCIWNDGVQSPQTFIDSVRDHEFDVIMVQSESAAPQFVMPDAVRQAIQQAYLVRRSGQSIDYLVPRSKPMRSD